MRDDRKEDDYMPEMPEIEGHHQLIGYLWDCGPTAAGGMGEAPLSHQDIWCWQENSGIELDAWEARMLRRLSGEYLAQCQASTSPQCPSPIAPPELSDDERNRVAEKVKGAFQMMMQTRPNRAGQ